MSEYIKTVWKNNEAPAIDEVKLNKIEDGIYTAQDELNDHMDDWVVHLSQEDIDAIAESVSHIIDANVHLSVSERAGLNASEYPLAEDNKNLTIKDLDLGMYEMLVGGAYNTLKTIKFPLYGPVFANYPNQGIHYLLTPANTDSGYGWSALEAFFDINRVTTSSDIGVMIYTKINPLMPNEKIFARLDAPTAYTTGDYLLSISTGEKIPTWKSFSSLHNTVNLTGDQTITSGVKTFTLSPLIPTPTTDYQAATKKYVDDGLDNKVDIAHAGVQQISGQKQFMLEVLIPDTPEHVNAAVPHTWANNHYVKLVGNETIGDIKTFTSSPIVPTPNDDMQAATKKYVDDLIPDVPVISVNTKTGEITLTQDDIGAGDTYTPYSLTEQSKLSGIEAGADVTDATNVSGAGAVMKSGNETIADIKTFTSSPIVPEPTTDMQSATKKYVDDHVVASGVSSVNTQVGAVTLTQDDIGDGVTNKVFSATEQSKLSGIEAAADVTDAINVAAAGAVMTSGAQTINNVKTFTAFPLLPQSAPSADYEAANKKYVDDSIPNIPVISVNTKTGAVVLTQDDVGSGITNKVFTSTDQSKLNGIEIAADVTDATNVGAAGAVMTSGNQTISGVKTFGNFPITPDSAPTANYEVANKKYVDDNLINGAVLTSTDQTIADIKTFTSSPIVPEPTTDYQAATKKYTDDAITSYVDALDLPDGEDLQEVVSYVDSMKMMSIIGVEWDSSEDSPTLRRIDYAGNTITTTQSTFDNHVIWGFMRRCSRNGSTISYGTNARGDGLTLNGSDDIFVEIPRFYVKVEKVGALYRWWVSPTPLSGFELHPAFKQHSINGEYYNYLYIAAYEASGFWHPDNSTMDLISRSGKRPITGQCGFPNLPGDSLTPTQAATYARNASRHYKLINVWVRSAPTLLFMIEYATLNAQTALGYGIMYKPWTGGFNGEYTGAHSADSNIGTNGTGTGTGTDGLTPIVYRGIENWWGNVTEFEPGLTMTTTYTWIPAPDDATATISIGDMITGDGYGERFNNTKYGMMALVPAGNGGKTSNTCLCDWNYYPRNDGGGTRVGGMFSDGDGSGPNNHAVWATGNSLYQGCRIHYLGD